MFFVLVITEWSNKHLAMVLFTIIGSFVSTITTQLLWNKKEGGTVRYIHIHRVEWLCYTLWQLSQIDVFGPALIELSLRRASTSKVDSMSSK
jgi:hypothetical protein